MVFAFLSLSEYAIIKQHINDIWQRKAVSQVHFQKKLPDQEGRQGLHFAERI